MSPPTPDSPRATPAPPDAAWAPTELLPRALPSRHGNALPAGLRLGEYELLRVLGEGGFGIVYLAHDHALQRRVAIKEYMPVSLAKRSGPMEVAVTHERNRAVFEAGLQGFINEARMLAQFDHASLVKVYRFWPANGTAYMVMPFYEGVTMKDKLRQMGRPPGERWLTALLGSLTEALTVLHAGHCLHRDIAPDNILLLADTGRPLLLDFGAARQVIGDATQALTAILKPGYAPVEQYAEVPSMRQGPWTDVYALCAVVYSAVMGRKPPVAVARTVVDAYEPLSVCAAGRYSAPFLQAIDDGLRLRPEERTASISLLRQALGLEAQPAPHGGVQPAMAPAPAAAAVHTVFMPTVRVSPPPARPPSPAAAAVPVAAPWPSVTSGQTRTADASTLAPVRVSAARPAAAPQPAASSPPATTQPTTGRHRLIVGAAAALVMLALAGGGAYWASQRGPSATAPAALPPAGAPPAVSPPSPAVPAAVTAPANPVPANALPATAAQPSPAWSVLAEFDRLMQARSADFQVSAMPAQQRLRVGQDRLSFTVRSARAGHVYVLVGGSDGSLMLLYPNSVAADQRLPAGQTLTLPQDHWPLDTSVPVGKENFLVIVSAHARDFSHLSQERDAWFLRLPTGSVGAALARAHGGTGSVLAGKARCDTPGCDVFGAARFTLEVVN